MQPTQEQQRILDLLISASGATRSSDKVFSWKGKCPCHDDHDDSLSFGFAESDGWIVLKCFANCPKIEILASLGITQKDLGPGKKDKNNEPKKSDKKKKEPLGPIEKIYDYVDESGNLLFQVTRHNPKAFRQRHWGGKNWVDGTKGIRRVLYRLPELLSASKEKVIIICEGEKDVDNIREKIGCLATTCPMGAERWDLGGEGYVTPFTMRHVVIVPDNDIPGQKHAKKVAEALSTTARSVKIVNLPNLPAKGDISDWIESGGTREQLKKIIDETEPLYECLIPEKEKPVIIINNRELPSITKDSINALLKANDPPVFFIRGTKVCRIQEATKDKYAIDVVDTNSLRDRLTRVAKIMHETTQSLRPVFPQKELLQNIMCQKQLPDYPLLEAIVGTPIIRPDGEIITEPGYDASTKLYYSPSPELIGMKIPDDPTVEHVERAKNLIYKIIGDFPFDNEASKANAFAAILTPLMQFSIDGMIPNCIVNAPTAGSGKSLMSKIITGIATGKPPVTFPVPKDEEAWEKNITTYLMRGHQIIVIDNLDKPLGSANFSQLLTSQEWTGRLLGTNKEITLPNNTSWITTGNNVQFRGRDLIRRSYFIRIDAHMECPWEREQQVQFAIPDIENWILENRRMIIEELMTMIKYWINQGSPKNKKLHLYQWSHKIGGLLECIGVPEFLGNYSLSMELNDDESPQWERFYVSWWEIWQDQRITVSMIMDESKISDLFRDSFPDSLQATDPSKESSAKTKLSRALARKVDNQYGDYTLRREKNGHTKCYEWRLEFAGKENDFVEFLKEEQESSNFDDEQSIFDLDGEMETMEF